MSAIIPMTSQIATANQNYLAPTVANFPALKHLFLFNEAVGTTTFTDSVGGVIIPVTATTAGNAFGVASSLPTIHKTTTTALTPSTGTFVSLDTAGKTTVIVHLGQAPAAGGIAMGAVHGSGARLALKSSATGHVLSDGTTTMTATAYSLSAAAATHCAAIVTGTTVNSFGIKTTDASVSNPAAAAWNGAITGTNYGIANALAASTSSLNYGMLQIWQFSSTVLPSDIASMVAWTHAQAYYNGLKLVYPGFAGRT